MQLILTLKKKKFGLLGLQFILWATLAQAATIERYDDLVMGCNIRLSGIIGEGDAIRLQAILDLDPDERISWETRTTPTERRICLDSPGGSFREAIQIARIIIESHRGTAVSAGSSCESACAIIFMAGGFFHPEGETASPNRILHPQGSLGFHAPRLVLSGGTYSAEEAERAYEIALQTISEIIELRSESDFNFPESLLLRMLRTPHEQMLRPQTVADAARWGITIAPVAAPVQSVGSTVINVCFNIDLAANDHFIDRYSLPDLESSLTFEISDQTSFAAVMPGFGLEGAGTCEVRRQIGSEHSPFTSGLATGPFGGVEVETMTGQTYFSSWYSFQAYPASTPITEMSADVSSLQAEFNRQFFNSVFQWRATAIASCWLTSSTARIANVSEFVNLRRQANFSAPVIRQVPLGERVRATRADNITVIGQERDRQACISACRVFGANDEDRTARDRAQQCIQDNMIWYEVTDARNNRGWVSRRYLEEAE